VTATANKQQKKERKKDIKMQQSTGSDSSGSGSIIG